jgi:hypothetical protein
MIAYLLRIKVLLAFRIFLEKFARPMTQEFVIGNLELESTRIPCVIECSIIGMNECQFLVCKSVDQMGLVKAVDEVRSAD